MHIITACDGLRYNRVTAGLDPVDLDSYDFIPLNKEGDVKFSMK